MKLITKKSFLHNSIAYPWAQWISFSGTFFLFTAQQQNRKLQSKLTAIGRQTSPAAACRDVTPELYVQRGCVPPLPSGSAETDVAHTYGCFEAAPSVYAPQEAETGSNLLDPLHLGSKDRSWRLVFIERRGKFTRKESEKLVLMFEFQVSVICHSKLQICTSGKRALKYLGTLKHCVYTLSKQRWAFDLLFRYH